MVKLFCWLGLLLWIAAFDVQSDVTVSDDLDRALTLSNPATRVVSLAPHLTEMMFTLDVGHKVVGTARYSNYPEQAKDIPRVGDAFSVSIEAIIAMRPDLILAWHTGGVNKSVNRLRDLGFPVYVNESPSLDSIGETLLKLGRLTGSPITDQVARDYSETLSTLKQSFDEPPRVFLQISDIDLYSVSDEHLMGQAIQHCGGQNVFAQLPASVAEVSQEAVIWRNPEYLFLTQVSDGPENPWFERWRTFTVLTGQLVPIDPNLISRPSFRMLAGIEAICTALGQAR